MYYLLLLYILPLLLSIITLVLSKHMWRKILISSSIIYCIISLCLVYLYLSGFTFQNNFVVFDKVNLIFTSIVTIISSIIALYGSYYFNEEIKHRIIGTGRAKHYLVLSNLFIFAMLTSATFKNIIMIWVALEATTIFTTSLISFYGTKTSWEAAWKYLIICGIGLTIGLFGVFLIIYAGLDNTDYNIIKLASDVNSGLAKIGFIFTFVGIGTKIGLFPLNTWLPDAHGSGPTPISATMSSILLPLAILYLYKIKTIVDLMLGTDNFTNFICVIMGLITIIAAGFSLIKQKHFKRALAYSSSENMGIIIFAIGLGPVGVKLGILHIIGHSFLKSAAFMSAGNILIKMKSGLFENVNNLLQRLRITGILFMVTLILLVGIPLSPLFFTEILIIIEAFKHNIWYAGMFVFGISLVFTGILRNFGNLYLNHALEKESECVEIKEDSTFSLVHITICISLFLALASNLLFFVDTII